MSQFPEQLVVRLHRYSTLEHDARTGLCPTFLEMEPCLKSRLACLCTLVSASPLLSLAESSIDSIVRAQVENASE
ncbi:hypothetical protein BOTBODRAFT_27045 [Botryobasidium botryosum FD-172 SS1]|uniref:Uncharacterized protein n=1 Tax=Botryobasidium botryosum (strain FD-172 SS1) TaxID=930990 RepID=A0A067MZ45_BOTB1|nr:hypothetical protein BOTBODRAFT_27045 [Botryobasidium botryosum FD-172 SS1]